MTRNPYTALLLLTAHAAVVCAALAFAALMEWQPTPDANIGWGIVMLGVSALGLPWSALHLAGWVGPDITPVGQVALLASMAVLNLGLHGAAWAWWLRPSAAPCTSGTAAAPR